MYHVKEIKFEESHLTNAGAWHTLADGLLALFPEIADQPRPLAAPALARPLVRNRLAILQPKFTHPKLITSPKTQDAKKNTEIEVFTSARRTHLDLDVAAKPAVQLLPRHGLGPWHGQGDGERLHIIHQVALLVPRPSLPPSPPLTLLTFLLLGALLGLDANARIARGDAASGRGGRVRVRRTARAEPVRRRGGAGGVGGGRRVGEPGAAVEREGGVGARGEERGGVRGSRHADAGEVWVWEAAVIASEEAGVGVAATAKWGDEREEGGGDN